MKLAINWKNRLKSYSSLSLIANVLVSLSISGLAVLGVLSSEFAFPVVVATAILFGVLGLVGRILDEAIDDGIIKDKTFDSGDKEDV
jgi:hypothetical protein